jgi:hypothetical protein
MTDGRPAGWLLRRAPRCFDGQEFIRSAALPRHNAPYGQQIVRAAANLIATERARQSACANEGAAKLSGGPDDLMSVEAEWVLTRSSRLDAHGTSKQSGV